MNNTPTLLQKIEAKKKEFAWLYSKKDPIKGIEMVDATQLAFLHTALTDIWNSAVEEAYKAVPGEGNSLYDHAAENRRIGFDQSRKAITKLLIK